MLPIGACTSVGWPTTRPEASALGRTYFVRADGDDSLDGAAPERAWRSLQRVNAAYLRPGDRVFFQAGDSFVGTLAPRASGTRYAPIRIGSFGAGRAGLRPEASGEGHGLDLEDVSHLIVENLEFDGVDRERSRSCGMRIRASRPGVDGLVLRDCVIRNHGGGGVRCSSAVAEGLRNLRISGVTVERCRGAAGILLTNAGPAEARSYRMFQHVVIRDCRVHDVIGEGWGWSGSGIAVFWATDVLVEYCEASETGRRSGGAGGGPVGIWLAAVESGTIQSCESHHNRSEGSYDGGGFDLDGGSRHCTIQYCYSHDNEGAGYVVNSFLGGPATYGSVIRFCISEHDGAGSSAPARGLALWNEGNEPNELRDTRVFGNTFFSSARERTALVRSASRIGDAAFQNNILVMAGTGPIARFRRAEGVAFQGNLYHAPDGRVSMDWEGVSYAGLLDWRAGAGQERLGAEPTGAETDPLLVAPGSAGTVGNPRVLAALRAYQLRGGSPAPTAGVDLRALDVDLGERDFFGVRLPSAGRYRAVGASAT